MRYRQHSGWQTTFGRWVADYGVPRLCQALNPHLHVSTPYHWIYGRHLPDPRFAAQIVHLSAGAVTFDDIYARAVAYGAPIVTQEELDLAHG